jgi:hypothetical protein
VTKRLGCPSCKYPQLVFADHGVITDCPWCETPLIVQADVVGHSLRERAPIVDRLTVDLALAHLRPEAT